VDATYRQRLEDDLFALLVEPLRRLKIAWEERSESPCLNVIALHDIDRSVGSTIWPPAISAHTITPGEEHVYAVEPEPRPARWRYHNLETDMARRVELSKRLTGHATLKTYAGYWHSFVEQYLDVLVRVAARIEAEVRRSFRVAPMFGVVVLDSARDPSGRQWGGNAEAGDVLNANLVRRTIGQLGLDTLFPAWAARIRSAEQGRWPAMRFAPSPIPDGARERWARMRALADRPAPTPGPMLREIFDDDALAGVEPRALAMALAALIEDQRGSERSLFASLEGLVVALDCGLEVMINEILHDPVLQRMESAWRCVAYLVDQIDALDVEGVQLIVMHATHEDLRADLDGADAERTGVYHHWVRAPYAPASRRPAPLAAVIDLGDFGPDAEDIDLLDRLAKIAMEALAPFITNADGAMFGDGPLVKLRDLATVFVDDRYARWNAFREVEHSRFAGVCVCRFRARLPYEVELPGGIRFREHVGGAELGPPWSPPSVLFAARIIDAFAKYRIAHRAADGPPHGPPGEIPYLPARPADALPSENEWREYTLASRREYELFEQGFVAWREKRQGHYAFLAAQSPHKPRVMPNTREGKRAETNYRLGTQLPYVLYVARFAQYLRVVRREELGALHRREDVEAGLQRWLDRLVTPDAPSAERMLEQARVRVLSRDDGDDALAFELELTPHLRYMNVSFELSCRGSLAPRPRQRAADVAPRG
jgi:type VI secretion system protein ImpC